MPTQTPARMESVTFSPQEEPVREPSTIPRSDGVVPSEIGKISEEEKRQQAYEMLEQASRPSIAEIKQQRAQEMGRKGADFAWKRMQASAAETAREQAKFKKFADDQLTSPEENAMYANFLNNMRKRLKEDSRIKHKFKPMYTAEMAHLKDEAESLKAELSALSLKPIILKVLLDGSKVLEAASIGLGFPWFNLSHLSDGMESFVQDPMNDLDIDQLCMELAPQFNVSPSYRLGFGLLMLVSTTAYFNSPAGKAALAKIAEQHEEAMRMQFAEESKAPEPEPPKRGRRKRDL